MMKCIAGTTLMSLVVGCLTYGSMVNTMETKERELQMIAMNACIRLGPPDEVTDPVALEAQLDLCNYGREALLKGRRNGR